MDVSAVCLISRGGSGAAVCALAPGALCTCGLRVAFWAFLPLALPVVCVLAALPVFRG